MDHAIIKIILTKNLLPFLLFFAILIAEFKRRFFMATQISYPYNSLAAQCCEYFSTKFQQWDSDNAFINAHIIPRVESVIKIVFVSFAGFVDGVVGVAFAASSIVTFGYIQTLNEYAMIHLHAFGRFAEVTVSEFFKLLNGHDIEAYLSSYSAQISLKFRGETDGCAFDKQSVLNRHMTARFHAIEGLCIVSVVKVVEIPFGLIALFFAILTLGSLQNLNDFASSNCNFLPIIPEIYIAVLKVLNPQAEFDPCFHYLIKEEKLNEYNFYEDDDSDTNAGLINGWKREIQND